MFALCDRFISLSIIPPRFVKILASVPTCSKLRMCRSTFWPLPVNRHWEVSDLWLPLLTCSELDACKLGCTTRGHTRKHVDQVQVHIRVRITVLVGMLSVLACCCFTFLLEQGFSAFLVLQPFHTVSPSNPFTQSVPRVVVTPSQNIIFVATSWLWFCFCKYLCFLMLLGNSCERVV